MKQFFVLKTLRGRGQRIKQFHGIMRGMEDQALNLWGVEIKEGH